MTVNLEKLNTAVELLISQPFFSQTTERLSEEINQTEEPFVWSVVDLPTIACELPENIRSCWIFVLKKDVPSGCHFHPNSIQHMVMLSGEGRSKVAAEEKRLKQFAASGDSLTESWVVIPEGVPHEFFPERENMVVVSFHTCAANELEEISCDTGEKRLYEGEN